MGACLTNVIWRRGWMVDLGVPDSWAAKYETLAWESKAGMDLQETLGIIGRGPHVTVLASPASSPLTPPNLTIDGFSNTVIRTNTYIYTIYDRRRYRILTCIWLVSPSAANLIPILIFIIINLYTYRPGCYSRIRRILQRSIYEVAVKLRSLETIKYRHLINWYNVLIYTNILLTGSYSS